MLDPRGGWRPARSSWRSRAGDGPPSDPVRIDRGDRAAASITPVLSIRRALDPLSRRRRRSRLRDGLDQFVAPSRRTPASRSDAGALRYEHRAGDPQAPASVQKLLTAVAALTELGPDQTLRDRRRSAPSRWTGWCAGDLYLRGGGDPSSPPASTWRESGTSPRCSRDIDRLADAVGRGRASPASRRGGRRREPVRHRPVQPGRGPAASSSRARSARCRRLSVNDGFAVLPGERRSRSGPRPTPPPTPPRVFDAALRERGVVVGGRAPLRCDTARCDGAELVAVAPAGRDRRPDAPGVRQQHGRAAPEGARAPAPAARAASPPVRRPSPPSWPTPVSTSTASWSPTDRASPPRTRSLRLRRRPPRARTDHGATLVDGPGRRRRERHARPPLGRHRPRRPDPGQDRDAQPGDRPGRRRRRPSRRRRDLRPARQPAAAREVGPREP